MSVSFESKQSICKSNQRYLNVLEGKLYMAKIQKGGCEIWRLRLQKLAIFKYFEFTTFGGRVICQKMTTIFRKYVGQIDVGFSWIQVGCMIKKSVDKGSF